MKQFKVRELAEIKKDMDIARKVYKLYNLTYEEVLIVDPEFALSEEEYEKFEVDAM